jgi:hypothetical protein
VTNPPKAPQAEFLPAGSESRNVATAREPIRSDPFRESGPAGITEEEMRYFAN